MRRLSQEDVDVGDTAAGTVDLKIDAGANGADVLFAVFTNTGNSTARQWVQAGGAVGPSPVWRTLATWGSSVTVGPLAHPETARFTVVAYDPARFTTALNGVNAVEA